MSAKDLKNELRELRKSHPDYAPVSRLKKADISAQIQKLKVMREETPPVASTVGALPQKSKPAVESIKEAKKQIFPVKPSSGAVKGKAEKAEKAPKKESPKKKESKLSKLMKMMESMTDSEEE